uniref:Fibrinogen C-terminal domain-containing protein n=1 Tax=Amphimedon queenslandica TaxID=400682 RepID=A0A1X7SIX5_AMPQE
LCPVPPDEERLTTRRTEREGRRAEQPKDIKKREQTTWNNKPVIVLLSLIVILQVGILCLLLAQIFTRDTPCTTGATTGAIAGNNGYPNFSQWANDVVSKVNSNVTESLLNIVNTLSNLHDTSTSTAGVVDDILLIAQELLVLHNDSTALPTSCKELKSRSPDSPSGYYMLASANGLTTYTAYCNMEELCGSGGGWTRLAYLDMPDATQNCPPGFRLYQSGGVRACGRPVAYSGGCASVQFPSNGISYSQICGRVTGYQYNSPSAFSNDLNFFYVDGVILCLVLFYFFYTRTK